MKTFQTIRRYLGIKFLFGLVLSALIAVNVLHLFRETRRTLKQKQDSSFYFVGLKFTGLDKILKNAEYIGYYTDKDLSKRSNAAQFSQAQYILAPAILDLNNTKREFILFDCTTEEKAWEAVKKIGAIPLRKNMFGIILARKAR